MVVLKLTSYSRTRMYLLNCINESNKCDDKTICQDGAYKFVEEAKIRHILVISYFLVKTFEYSQLNSYSTYQVLL